MKSSLFAFRNLRLTASLAVGLGLSQAAWSKPSIQLLQVTPSPLVEGQAFTLIVTASANVQFATATVDFHPGKDPALEVPLTLQGGAWRGSGVVPTDLRLRVHKDEGKIKAVVVDGAGRRDEETLKVDVLAPSITAMFAGGVLTVTGDDEDNTIIVSRDPAGNILVNDGAVSVAGGSPTVANTSLIQIAGLGGNDVLTVDDANGPMPPGNLSGGDGDDILTGSASDDQLDGGPGNDILIGGRGNDVIHGGDGDDQIIWNPGDGSDVVEGGGGQNTLVFNGANVGEKVDLSANGRRLRFFRDVANITMDCDGIQRVRFHALGGADVVTVNDLTGTQVTNVLVDLSNSAGQGDGEADTVILDGTGTNDQITLSGSVTNVDVCGLSATVTVTGADAGLDTLVINGLGGDDVIDASGVQAGAINLTLNGGAGDDTLIGGQGDDLLNGGPGSDTLFGGPGDDTFVWNPGDGSDTIEGQVGQDTLLFNGANVGEQVQLAANGQRLRLTRDVAAITMDCNGVEFVQFNALGGADTITVNDLTGTDVTDVTLDLAAPPGSGAGDGQSDRIIVNGTAGEDTVTITGSAAAVNVLGLAAAVHITGSDPAFDQLLVNLLGGDDALEAANLAAGVINLTVDGGPGADVLVGSAGADVLLGGEGDDVLIGGPGLDTLDGGPGNNVLIQD